MSEEDRIAQGLESGVGSDLSPAEHARLEELRQVLGSDFLWEEPPADLADRITGEIAPARPSSVNWIWMAAAALILVLGTIGVMSLLDEDIPPSVATVAMEGTEFAPEATGTAELIPTPNGWAIAFDATGLPPAGPGTFYEAWVYNGQQGVAVGTFHMRGDEPTSIALWSGVDLHEYRTVNVTLEGVLVMTGTATEFSDE